MLRVFAFVSFVFAFIAIGGPVEARRVALVVGQNAYPGGASATIGLPRLDNPVLDAHRMAEILAKHGFDVISCDGTTPGCFDLNRSGFLDALKRLEESSPGADLALVFFAGHGLATEEGNVLTPVDARVNCATGAVTQGVLVERIMAATQPARMKLIILDACRDNPLGDVCPNLKGKKLSFTRIEAGAMRGLLLVTSTQFGQEALDGPPGVHSPFAAALFSTLEANPGIYFEQVFNEVARATYEAAQKEDGFLQIPGKVVGGEAPADCLAGRGCVGDARMAALEAENQGLAADASGVRNLLAAEEQARGKPYTAEERSKRVAELHATLARIGTSANPLRQEARRLIDEGNVEGGRAKLEEALDADEKAIAEVTSDRRKTASRSARDLAVLTRGADVMKAVAYYQRAVRLDPANAQIWDEYARAVLDAGRTDEAKAAFEQAALKAQDSNNPRVRYWATLGLGDVAVAQGNLPSARQLYNAAVAMAEPTAKADPGNTEWQRNLSVSHNKIGDVLQAEGNLPAALESYRAALTIRERLAKADPGNARWQRDLSVSHNKIGDVLRAQGNLPAALESYKADLAIAERLAKADPAKAGSQYNLGISNERIGDVLMARGNLDAALTHYRAKNNIISRLAKADPGNAEWQRDLAVSQVKIGGVLQAQGNLPAALESYKANLAIAERLVKADPANAGWQRDLSMSHNKIGDVLQAQGNLPAALESYRAALAIRERLAKADPGNAGWQRDLSVSQGEIGDVLRAQGNLPAALESYRAALAISERLAKADPGNAGWQRDLSVSHNKIGDVLRAQGNLPAALESYRASHAIFERLVKADRGNAEWQRDLAVSQGKIGGVLQAQGNLPAALESYKADFAIAERLAKADPANAGWQADLAASHGKLGQLLVRMGRREEALDNFRRGRAIIAPLAAAAPDHAQWRDYLATFDHEIARLAKAKN